MRDVLAEIRELRVTMLELRAGVAEHRLRTGEQLDDLRRRNDTLFAAVAEFRAEYGEHHHGEA